MKKKVLIVLISFFLISFSVKGKKEDLEFKNYHTPKDINKIMKDIAGSNKKISKLYEIAESAGGNKVYIIEIGPEVGKIKKTFPAIFVASNFSGINMLSSEASVFLMKDLIEKPEHRKDKTWYILPEGNPDAAWNFFKKPLLKDSRNMKPFNDDKDDRTDEDGFEDLNGDGLISKMRLKHPEGEYIPVEGEKRLMKKADPVKGEKGVYKIYTEGLDNDGDGKFNEDGKGGVDISRNFPHLFKFFTKTGGYWSGSESEVYNLFKFIFSHKEIAMTITLGETNFCMIPPRGGRKGQVDYTKIKIPKRMGKFLNVDVEKSYSMKEIMEIVKKIVPQGFEVSESMVASFLGLGAVVNPLKNDLKFYKEISEEYKKYLKKVKHEKKRLDPPKAKDGSFELWSYYHLGLPTFTMDFWTLPKIENKKKLSDITPEKLEKMTKEEFLAMGKDKINSFLKSSGAPENIKADFIINAVKSGQMTPKKIAGFLKKMPEKKDSKGGKPEERSLLSFSDKNLGGKGFTDWKKFKHPTLGNVEIGGAVPYAAIVPPPEMIKELLNKQVPFIFELTKKISEIKIKSIKIKNLGAGLYEVKVWIENRGYLPYPTEMGKKNGMVSPVVVTLSGKGIKFIEGRKRSLIKNIGGLGTKMVKWLVFSKYPVKAQIKSETKMASRDIRSVVLGGEK